jgi:hypothetical protein
MTYKTNPAAVEAIARYKEERADTARSDYQRIKAKNGPDHPSTKRALQLLRECEEAVDRLKKQKEEK